MNVGDFRKSARHHLRRAVQFHRAGTLKTDKIGRNLEVQRCTQEGGGERGAPHVPPQKTLKNYNIEMQ
jgi:hypothetical protein